MPVPIHCPIYHPAQQQRATNLPSPRLLSSLLPLLLRRPSFLLTCPQTALPSSRVNVTVEEENKVNSPSLTGISKPTWWYTQNARATNKSPSVRPSMPTLIVAIFPRSQSKIPMPNSHQFSFIPPRPGVIFSFSSLPFSARTQQAIISAILLFLILHRPRALTRQVLSVAQPQLCQLPLLRLQCLPHPLRLALQHLPPLQPIPLALTRRITSTTQRAADPAIRRTSRIPGCPTAQPRTTGPWIPHRTRPVARRAAYGGVLVAGVLRVRVGIREAGVEIDFMELRRLGCAAAAGSETLGCASMCAAEKERLREGGRKELGEG